MTPLSIAVLAFVFITGAGFLGLALRPHETQKAEPVRDMVRFTQGIVASISALVLGLLVAGATDHYRSQSEQVRRMAAEVIVLDRALAQFGPEAAEVRRVLHGSIEHSINEIWAGEARRMTMPPGPNMLDMVMRLEAATPGQAFLQGQAQGQVVTLARTRATLATAEHGGAIQVQVVVMLVLWFVFLFLLAGLYGQPDRLAIGAMVLGSAAVASALLLVLELDRPFHGMMAVSDAPMREALATVAGVR
ncbi:hypothetical protein J5Y09_08340 [Roseomonas sp. PWR1]|uniref:DUF4239 domain-containing protein n=1 Tax=Roseomonas nitratireducens TaxID=2820810 RepID=A0ABS4ASY6_9PROT|nr:hypothetical protein [Neoroseomonas nitratireducens]MBP0463916.1 hypothetical protein [Neoroseomonas nitratireducens]